MKNLLIFLFFFGILRIVNAQVVDGRFIETLNGNKLEVTVQINLQSDVPGTTVGLINITFNYNSSGLTYESVVNHTGFAGGNITESGGTVTINISTFTPSPLTTSNFDVATFTFNVDNANLTSQLTWGTTNIYQGFGTVNPHTAGNWPDSNNPLPVELVTFEANPTEEGIALNWQTATEVNNYGFEVERAVITEEEKEWDKIGFVEGHGNSNSPKDYSFVDKYPTGGIKFAYRLKQVDIDGGFEYSDEVEVDFTPKELAVQQNFPNPFNPSTNIRFSLPEASKVKLEVYNVLGERVALLVNEVKEAGNHQVRFNASHLSSGYYIYRLVNNGEVFVKKMLLVK